MISRFILSAIACATMLAGCDWFVSTQQHIARAEQHMADGADRAAAIELQNALGSEPDNVRARLMLARVSLRMDDVKAAEAELERAIADGATPDQWSQIAADALLAKNEPDALISRLENGELMLDKAQSSVYLGLAQLARGDTVKATAAFDEALTMDPGASRARLGIAEAQAQQGDIDGALVEVAKVLESRATDPHALLLKGRLLSRRGDFAASAEALGLARQHSRGQFTAFESHGLLSMLIEAQTASGDLAGARRDLAELAKQAPDAPLVHLLSARIAMVEQKYSVAVTEAQKVVAAAPDHPLGRLLLGSALLANGNYHQAEAQLSELVRLAPENSQARKLLAEVNLRLQRPDVAMQVLSTSQQDESPDPQVSALMGWANLQRGDSSAAIDLLKRGVAAQPDNANLKLDLAVAYMTVGRHAEAVALLETLPASSGGARREQLLIAALGQDKAKPPYVAQAEVARIVRANRDDVGILNVAAAYYSEQRDYTRARELLNAAATLDAKNTGTLANRARLEIAAGDIPAAQRALRDILAADPQHQAARVTLAQLALQSNDTAAAVTELEAARRADASAIEPRLLLASHYLRQKQPAEANKVLEELDAIAEVQPAVAVVIGRLYAEAGRFDEALARFQDAERREPTNASWSLEVARAQVARGDTRAARGSVQKALNADANSIPANTLMVALDLRDKRAAEVRSRLAKLKQAHPDNARVALLEGEVNLALREVPAADRAYSTSYRLQPSSSAAIGVYRARSIARQPAATALLSDWLARAPGDVGARMILAQGLIEQRQHTQAMAEYERLIADGQSNAAALNNLAWLYSLKRDPRALEVGKRAYDLARNSPSVADTYGWILVQHNRAAEAVPLLESAAAVRGAPPEVHYHLAVARARAGRKDEARAALRTLVAGPEFEQIADARKLLAELGG